MQKYEWEWLWLIKVLSQHLPGETEKNHEPERIADELGMI